MTPSTSAQQNGESVHFMRIGIVEFRKSTKKYMDLALSGEVIEIDRLGIVYTLTKKNEESVHKVVRQDVATDNGEVWGNLETFSPS